MFQGFGPPGDLRGPFLQSVSRICWPGAAPAISGGPFLMSVSKSASHEAHSELQENIGGMHLYATSILKSFLDGIN